MTRVSNRDPTGAEVGRHFAGLSPLSKYEKTAKCLSTLYFTFFATISLRSMNDQMKLERALE